MDTGHSSLHPDSLAALKNKEWSKFKTREMGRISPRGVAVVTTMSPENPQRQIEAVKNWQKLDFPIFSLNLEIESKGLKDFFPGVKFEEPSKTAEHIVGKPLVLFDSILDCFANHGELSHIVILNSDIQVPTSSTFWRTAVDLAGDGLLFGSRVETNGQDCELCNIFHVGFDFFILSKSLISCYPASEFCLGAPWWDYWVPFVAINAGMRCIYAHGTFATHAPHEIKQKREWYEHYCREFASRAENLDLSPRMLNERWKRSSLHGDHCNDFSFEILSFIYKNSEIVFLD